MTHEETELLVKKHGKAIHGFCLHLTGRRDSGEELFQETMLRMLQVKERIRADEDLRTARNYCMGIAVKLYRYQYRKASAHPVFSLDDESARIGFHLSSGLSPEQTVQRMQEMQEVRDAIRSLPEKQREAVYLFYYAEQSLREISETLKIPEGTVKSRLNAAKKTLGKRLEEM